VLISDSSNGWGIELGIQKIDSKRGTTTQADRLISTEGYLRQSGLSAIISRTRIRTLGAISGKLRRYLNWVEGSCAAPSANFGWKSTFRTITLPVDVVSIIFPRRQPSTSDIQRGSQHRNVIFRHDARCFNFFYETTLDLSHIFCHLFFLARTDRKEAAPMNFLAENEHYGVYV
jgi:hypothetical protein